MHPGPLATLRESAMGGHSAAVSVAFWCLNFGILMAAQREHKVHNIVLYPHKHSWCKTTPIKQVIAYPGCNSVEMDNNVCVGGCFSYSIPRTVPSSPGEVVPYCDSCQPSVVTWKHVTLTCTSGEYEGEVMTKRVEVIENCTCATCKDQFASPQHAGDLEMGSADAVDSEGSLMDEPQLLGLMHSARSRLNGSLMFNHSHVNESVINERMLMLLGELSGGSDEVSAPDQVALKEILNHVEGEDHKVNEATLADFVRKVEEQEHINIDIERLRKVLAKLENAEQKKNLTHQHNQRRHQHMIGPHHSLVLERNAQDVIHSGVFLNPTLDIAPHHLKPALEGSELSYHDNLVPSDNQEQSQSETDHD